MTASIARRDPEKNADPPSAALDFTALFQEYYPRVYNYLRYRTSTAEDAEDLISQVFEKAYRARAQFDADKATFSTWIFRIAHNTLANYYRSRQRRSAWESGETLPEDMVIPGASLEAQVIRQETLGQIWQGLERLDERDQEIISLKFAGQLSNQEIGQIMNLGEKHVSVVLLRAMRRLQKEVRQIGL